jgi:hypothetical protein
MRSICFVILARICMTQDEVCSGSMEHDHVQLLQVGLQMDLQAKPHAGAKPLHDDELVVLQKSMEALTSSRKYNRSLPIFVTMSDSEFLPHLRPWSARLRSLGLGQQVILSLDSEVDAEAARYDLPAIDSEGTALSMLATMARKPEIRKISSTFSFLKFAAPQALLAIGFEEVVFTEMDVFFFQNPSAVLNDVVLVEDSTPYLENPLLFLTNEARDALRKKNNGKLCLGDGFQQQFEVDQTEPSSADYVAMVGFLCSNMGFMKFRGYKMAEVLKSYLNSPDAQEFVGGGNFSKGADSVSFNSFLMQNPNVSMGMLPNERFSSTIQGSRGSEMLLHLSDSSLGCKHHILDQLYNDTNLNVSHAADEYRQQNAVEVVSGDVC